MRGRARRFLLAATAFLPQFAKRLVYAWGFGYRIGRDVRIGLAYLDCRELVIEDGARIGHGVVFLHCGAVRIGREALLGPLNLFHGGERIDLGDYSMVRRFNFINAIRDHDAVNDPDSSFELGYGAVITAEHRVDFTDRVRIGRCSVLAGRNSSIWTHNIQVGRPVEIGDFCYIGSECRLAPGAAIPDCCVVGLGSVVTRPIAESHSLIAGVPARRRRAIGPQDHSLIFHRTRADLPPQEYPAMPAPVGVAEAAG